MYHHHLVAVNNRTCFWCKFIRDFFRSFFRGKSPLPAISTDGKGPWVTLTTTAGETPPISHEISFYPPPRGNGKHEIVKKKSVKSLSCKTSDQQSPRTEQWSSHFIVSAQDASAIIFTPSISPVPSSDGRGEHGVVCLGDALIGATRQSRSGGGMRRVLRRSHIFARGLETFPSRRPLLRRRMHLVNATFER